MLLLPERMFGFGVCVDGCPYPRYTDRFLTRQDKRFLLASDRYSSHD